MEPQTPERQSAAIPVAIIAGFAMIAIAIFFTGGRTVETPAAVVATDSNVIIPKAKPVTAEDYTLGNPNAPIVLIEYSDYDCPFCKQFHATMHQIMDEYGVTGRVAWVYRQFPLVDLHPNATLISEAALCVGDIGGNSAFWTFSDTVFESRFETEPTNVTKLAQFAEAAGVDQVAYKTCMDSDRMMDRMKSDMADGLAAGAQGTPYTMIKVGNEEVAINGAESYETMKGIIANLIEQLDGTFDPEAPAATEEATPAS